MVITRFAPSPTGYLHLGGARTALFAWGFARQQGGRFLLRMEDTDAARSARVHGDAIIAALEWLGLSPDEPPVFQSANRERHRRLAHELLAAGKAYYCYCTPEELAEMRAGGGRYNRRWRDSDESPPADVAPVIRHKTPLTGETAFEDAVKGRLATDNGELDDFVILRSDGSPTYNLAASADDVESGITHIIRGDDHVMNTFRQWHLFAALTDKMPVFAHLPMILAADGADETGAPTYSRMSKRNAAVDVNAYRRDGFLAAAMCNYLARLSWGCGDAELFGRDFFVKNFSFAAVSAAAARFDMDKLRWLNREHLRRLPPRELRDLAGVDAEVGDDALALLAPRAETLTELCGAAQVFAHRPSPPAELLARHLPATAAAAFARLCGALGELSAWTAADVKKTIKETAAAEKLSFRQFGMPMRVLMFGAEESPDIAESAAALGKTETLARLRQAPAARQRAASHTEG